MMGVIECVCGLGVWFGYVFLFVIIVIYVCIGLICCMVDLIEYYVVGCCVLVFFNGMVMVVDWMSVVLFIGLVGIVFVLGYEGFVYVMGWMGGYCFVVFFFVLYLCKFGGYMVLDFLVNCYGNGECGGSFVVCGIVVLGVMLCLFVYFVV